MQLPQKKFEFVFSYCCFPPPHPHYHVAQLPIGGLRISNIRSKSKSKYPVTILFENAQPYTGPVVHVDRLHKKTAIALKVIIISEIGICVYNMYWS